MSLLADDPPITERSRYCPYTARSFASSGDISGEWLWPWETEGDDWAALDHARSSAQSTTTPPAYSDADMYLEVDESPGHAPAQNNTRGGRLTTEQSSEEDREKVGELQRSARAWFY